MTKTKYKALAAFQGHQPGDEFEAELDEALERRATERGQIKKVTPNEEGGEGRWLSASPSKTTSRSTPSTCPTSPAASSSQSEHERVDVSGFNATGANEYLAGQTEQEVTVEFFGSYGATEVHATLYPIHRDREVVAFEWRPDQTAVVSATNPQLEGNVQLLTYNPSATRGEEEAWEATFVAADRPGSPTPPAP